MQIVQLIPLRVTVIAVAACAALSTGCAMLSPDCAQDWRAAGYRDGGFGTQARDIQYAAACGAQFDRSRYLTGWKSGASTRP